MFARGGFQNRSIKGEAAKVAELLPQIHELSSQSIQGGAPNDHYHVTAAELSFLQFLLEGGFSGANKVYEPITDGATGDFLYVGNDIMVAFGGGYAAP